MQRSRDPRWRFAAVLVVAAAIAMALAAASRLSVDEQTAAPRAPAPATATPSLFAGIEQRGTALGLPTAPVTLVEYADLQCPYCAQWAREALPTIVDDYVRGGKVRIVFQGLAFIGPDSDKALRTALAAGEENRLWEVVHGLYASQGAENAGWVTDDLVRAIAAGVPDLDAGKLLAGRWHGRVETQMRRAAAAAEAAGIRSTPSFQVGRTGGPLQVVEVGSLDADGIAPALDAALAE
jgi:protein-disulfide isomerase